MATDVREQIKTVEEIRNATTFSYSPVVMALKNQVRYSAQDADQHKFATFDVLTDSIRAEILTTEQTEKANIKGRTSTRVFNIYLAGAKAIVSYNNKYVNLQKQNDKVIRGYSQLFDRWALGGDRGNNGLLVSSDPNYITEESVELPAANNGDNWNQVEALSGIFTELIMRIDATTGDNEILVYTYGDQLSRLLASITKNNETVVRTLMEQKFTDKTVRFISVPKLVLPAALADQNGIVVVSQNLTTLEMCQAPTVKSNGQNDEDEYYWANYIVGSVQVSPDEEGAIIKQPLTFAAA